MRSNRNIRIGIALMSGAFLLLVLFLVWKFSRGPAQPNVADSNVASNSVTPIAMRSDRRSAVLLVNLPARSIVTADMLQMDDVQEGMSTAGMITDVNSQAVGFITNRPLRRNDRLRSNDFVGHISQVGIAGALQPGTRAMMVPIPSKPTLHDLVRVGDFVDIIASFDQQESRTIIENVRVLAVDVFVKDYPATTGAMRGPYKAPALAVRSIDPAPAPAANPSTPAATLAPGQPAPAPTPTPTPTPAPQSAPSPALTLEVTPDQANRISLAQNSGAAIDFLIVPRSALPVIVPGAGGELRPVSVTRAQLAPYAETKRNSGGAKAGSTPRTPSSGSRPIREVSGDSGPIFPGSIPVPENTSNPGLLPLPVENTTPQRSTYDIPVYIDGSKTRVDTVLKPN